VENRIQGFQGSRGKNWNSGILELAKGTLLTKLKIGFKDSRVPGFKGKKLE
jgi:hypothetical protein